MTRTLFRLLSLLSLARAVRRGPGAVARRQARRNAYKAVRRLI